MIIRNLETREGREECLLIRNGRKGSSIEEIIEHFKKYDALTGVGLTEAILPNQQNGPIMIEIKNPYIKNITGSAKSLLFSWWCGVLSELLGRELDIRSVTYDKDRDIMRCTLETRQGTEQPANRG